MAYSPLGGASSTLLRDPTLARIGAAHDCSAAAVALAWTIRSGMIIAIPVATVLQETVRLLLEHRRVLARHDLHGPAERLIV